MALAPVRMFAMAGVANIVSSPSPIAARHFLSICIPPFGLSWKPFENVVAIQMFSADEIEHVGHDRAVGVRKFIETA